MACQTLVFGRLSAEAEKITPERRKQANTFVFVEPKEENSLEQHFSSVAGLSS